MKIEKLVPGGQGLATMDDGRKIFLWNALPGEEVVEYEVTKTKKTWCEGVTVKVEGESLRRVAAKDECYLATSPWQIFDYQYELECKRELLVEQFRQEGIVLDPPAVATDGRDYHYRNKMEYALYYDHETAKIWPAFRRRGTHQKVPVRQSSIERPEIWAEACRVIDDLNARGEEARKYQSLLIRCSADGQVAGGLLENGKAHPVFPNLKDRLLDREYSYSPNGFFQINLPVYEMALREIRKWITTGKVLDLYAGVGTIGLSVAGERELCLVENNKDAYLELEKNLKRFSRTGLEEEKCHALASGRDIHFSSSNLKNVLENPLSSFLANSEEMLDLISADQTVIVDPPRAGCDKKLIERLLEVGPAEVIYLSCNPATQARDAKNLVEKYEIVATQAFNFFPRTPHLENLLVFRKRA